MRLPEKARDGTLGIFFVLFFLMALVGFFAGDAVRQIVLPGSVRTVVQIRNIPGPKQTITHVIKTRVPGPTVTINHTGPTVVITAKPRPAVTVTSAPLPQTTATITSAPLPAPTVTVTSAPLPAPTVTVTSAPLPAPTVTVTSAPLPAPTVTVPAQMAPTAPTLPTNAPPLPTQVPFLPVPTPPVVLAMYFTASPGSQFLTDTNAARTSSVRTPYVATTYLASIARNWAKEMASSNTLKHNPNLATVVNGWQFVGENVGVGYDAPSIQQAFMASPLHRANILDKDFTQVGIGVAYGGGRLWVDEVFRRPVGACTPPFAAGAVYKVGSWGYIVQRIQHRVGVPADGIYGTVTRAAIAGWQRDHNWRQTGVATGTMLRLMRVPGFSCT